MRNFFWLFSFGVLVAAHSGYGADESGAALLARKRLEFAGYQVASVEEIGSYNPIILFTHFAKVGVLKGGLNGDDLLYTAYRVRVTLASGEIRQCYVGIRYCCSLLRGTDTQYPENQSLVSLNGCAPSAANPGSNSLDEAWIDGSP